MKQKPKIKLICKFCNEEFLVHPCRIKKAKYCSIQCHNKSRIGKKLSIETIKNMCGKKPWNAGIINKIATKCRFCRKIIYQWPSRKAIYCSVKCRVNDMILEKHHNWKGGKYINKRGYIVLRAPNHPNKHNSYYPEHRIVMEKHIGRYLDKKEVVHHINENKLDNRIENLMLFSNNGTHRCYHRWHK